MTHKIAFISGALLLTLSACGGATNFPTGRTAANVPTSGKLCDTAKESFLHYPELYATGVPDGNFAIVVGKAPAGTRVALQPVGDYNKADVIYGTTFAPVSGQVPEPSYPLPPNASASDLRQSMVPALQPKTMYAWSLSPNSDSCAASGAFTTQ